MIILALNGKQDIGLARPGKMKILFESWRKYINEEETPQVLYHGTSIVQYERIKDNGYNVKDFYLADVSDKSADYAEKQSIADGSEESIILTIDTNKLDGEIRTDPGSNPEELEYDMGQWVFIGNIEDAIIDEERW